MQYKFQKEIFILSIQLDRICSDKRPDKFFGDHK